MRNKVTIVSLMILLANIAAQAQITIAGNVFGGAREADVDGSSTVTVLDGNIQNVYGGNDISGTVKGGTNLDIRHSILGDVFGGGNGSYYYTTHSEKLPESQYYQLYTVPDGSEAIDVLSAYIPHQDVINIHIAGTSANDPTYIGGRVFCGGNCATVKGSASLKLGSHVIAGSVFLGSNGENLIMPAALTHYNNELTLTTDENMKKYMVNVAVTAKPAVTFDEDYVDYSTKIGSFFCGGNAGSMKVDGMLTLNFNKKFIIFEKLVGGSNTALVPAKTNRNYAYEGGVIGNAGANGDKLTMNLQGVRLEPRKLSYDAANGFKFDWNVDDKGTTEGDDPAKDDRLVGANIYGGCYTSGIVNGNVTINILETTAEKSKIFSDDATEGNSGIPLDQQGNDPLGSALNIFGGGYGTDSEIRGNTVLNVNSGYSFQVFGGGEKGNVTSNCTVNLNGGEVEYLYGGGFVGPVQGNTLVNLGGGKVYDVYGGSCNADITGYTEVFIGRNGSLADAFPTIRHGVFGGNDLGGTIIGSKEHAGHGDETKTSNTYVEYLLGSVGTENEDGNAGIFGGNFGNYDYQNDYTTAKGFSRPYAESSFVNFKPKAATTTNTLPVNNYIVAVFGGSLGTTGDYTCSTMQHDSYVLVEAPQSATNYTETDIYGGGAYAGMGDKVDGNMVPGAGHTVVDLYTGQVHDVFGGCNKEGLLGYARVNVPESSTIKVHSLFGGGKGYDINSGDFDPTLFCDTYVTLVDYNSENARVKDAIYGGNMNCRIACDTYLNITKPVWSNRESGYIASVYGAGYGRKTVSGRTHVYLNDGAKVWYAFGGGRDGNTFNYVSLTRWLIKQLGDHYSYMSDGADKTAKILAGVAQYKGFLDNFGNYLTAHPIELPAPISTNVVNNMRDTPENPPYDNTNVFIKKGAIVGNYAFGGGEGENANVCGTTNIQLLGGKVGKDLYGGGYGGPMEDEFKVASAAGGELQKLLEYNPNIISTLVSSGIDFADTDLPVKTNVYVAGGTCRNVYGGGYKGNIGYHGTDLNNPDVYTTQYDIANAETHVTIGIREDQPDDDLIAALTYVKGSTATKADLGFYCGVPAIERNAYGAGEMSAIYGTANLTMNNGYIGYRRFAAVPTTDADLPYIQNGSDYYQEKIHDETWEDGVGEDRLKDCGSIYGAGYDDLSSVDFTNVVMWGGTVRSCLHGGGEIATVGRGKIVENGASRVLYENNYYKAGGTKVTMYNGRVFRNVFGGGRGYNFLGYGGGNKLYTDGYVFGSTEVYIHGGEIGTVEGVIVQEDGTGGYGNVFGGGDIGFVYGKGYFSDKTKQKIGTGSPGHTYYYDDQGNLTEDCKVVVAPYLQVKNACTINGHSYAKYDYVPTDDLNTLPKKNNGSFDGAWLNLYTGANKNVANATDDKEERGITIRNAVFAGGNVSSNSDQTYANATTVFGNTTATLYDVYHRDFITVGTEHIGGLYGGGNLSVVGGYRELNITNYGTDYYGLNQQITLDDYQKLSNRERAYFQLQYVCQTDNNGFTVGQKISEEAYNALPTSPTNYQSETYWKQFGFCSIYAGRLLNTIQRADLCGVFGSRMVLQGAKDRVADVADATAYTINRVGELSLNAQASVRQGSAYTDPDTGSDAKHGNYFGIYSVVNCLGNLTSDVKFGDYYIDGNGAQDNSKTYYSYKASAPTSRNRNKGTAYNLVALASGVFLELTTENSTADKKDYGYVTGIVELDLINVKKDIIGGGYVYAKNEHRVPRYYPNKTNVILSEYNSPKTVNGVELRDELRTYRRYRYSTDQAGDWPEDGAYVISHDDDHVYQTMSYQTSGNFIHPSKRIVDDCYPTTNAYTLNQNPYSPAHYWYVKGDVYIYDQLVSAYTGSATAYPKEVKLPLTITAASNGKLKLLNVQPNLYAYYANSNQSQKLGTDSVTVNNETEAYYLNDVISYWDWTMLNSTEQKYFVPQTYVNVVSCTIDGVTYKPGTYVMNTLTGFNKGFTYTDDSGNAVTVNSNDADYTTKRDYMFRSSNNIGHNTGYALTFDMDSPKNWDDWYSVVSGDGAKINKATYTNGETNQSNYIEGPTYRPFATAVYGKTEHNIGDIITKEVWTDYPADDQNNAKRAYVAKETITYTSGTTTKTVNAGTAIPKTEWNSIISETEKNSFAEAWVCTSTVKLTDGVYILYGDLLTADQISTYKTTYGTSTNGIADEIDASTSEAYICTVAGTYGGRTFSNTNNYSVLSSWCSLSSADRANFTFNQDALDLLLDDNFGSNHQAVINNYGAPYNEEQPVEYQAKFTGTNDITSISYTLGGTPYSFSTSSDPITRDQFENNVPNEKRHYTKVSVPSGGKTIYIANTNFINGDVPIAKGQEVEESVYNVHRDKVVAVPFTNSGSVAVSQYYCYEDYTPLTTTVPNSTTPITTLNNTNLGKSGSILSSTDFGYLLNYQQYFTIQGIQPTGVATLYVTKESDIKDVTKEKIITVIYQYTYNEEGDDNEVQTTNELHVVNIHLELESGVPQIGPLGEPGIVLPGNTVGMKLPSVNPGLYEVLTSGWEMFDNKTDAENHRNGKDFINNSTPVYWYQNGQHYVAFYAKTYLGKTYSNPVPLNVANYHDLSAVMADKEHHMYIDQTCLREPKIYINDYSADNKNGLDLLKDLFTLSTGGTVSGHSTLNTSKVGDCKNLEFFLKSDLSHTDDWEGIGDTGESGHCFEGTLHGDGHTISGLTSSLFNRLCGEVYNLGVTGSFTTAGIADNGSGYLENCWVKTSETAAEETKALFNNPKRTVPLVNCYYPTENGYTAQNGATAKSLQAFYNGEVAYDLNDFYLFKRYSDHNTSTITGNDYDYLIDEGGITLTRKVGHYPDNPTGPYLLNDYQYRYVGSYVENRYADGDFRYADGKIPSGTDIRYWTTGEGESAKTGFAPVWPDDYLFFGQMLSYGYVDDRPYQPLPSHLEKNADNGYRLYTDDANNRVFRAPAYFGNSTMSVAHFNPNCILATQSSDKNYTAYPNMTAIDFTGGNGDVSGGYQYGLNSTTFYPPLLDDDGLSGIRNVDETKNLLVYTGTSTTAAAKTDAVVSDYLLEPAFTETNTSYRTVAVQSTDVIKGHHVQLSSDKYVTSVDHLLVDKQDFNCPIAYKMGSGMRMWYQREPDNYVTITNAGKTIGWEGVSLPFAAELVTTQDKGEITHFYQGSTKGHEYWLRQYNGGSVSGNEFVGIFNPMAAGSNTKDYTNTYLWDYYYSHNDDNNTTVDQDKNGDDYQSYEKEYYKTAHSFNDYPYNAVGTPYLIGFPGMTYYEFDLSGQWTPSNRYKNETILNPGQQTITFASVAGATVAVSDAELTPTTVEECNYTFVPNYINKVWNDAKKAYVLAADGGSYEMNKAGATVGAFRPYFMGPVSNTRGAEVSDMVERVVFGSDYTNDLPHEEISDRLDGTLNIYAKKGKIVVESSLRYTVDVSIYTPAGIAMYKFPVKAGETVEQRINSKGVYIVHSDDGQHMKKVIVR